MTPHTRLSQEFQRLQAYVDRALSGDGSKRILEAGCGGFTHIRLPAARLVGIDISQKQLERNTSVHEKVLGDIQSYHFPDSSFDAVICFDVLEHLPHPERALQRFSQALKREGLLILKLPNVLSLKGLITKVTPLRLHKFAFRYSCRVTNFVPRPDYSPFKTYLRFSISAGSLKKQARNLGMTCDYYGFYDAQDFDWLRKKRMLYTCYIALTTILRKLSLGKIGDSEMILVLKKCVSADTHKDTCLQARSDAPGSGRMADRAFYARPGGH